MLILYQQTDWYLRRAHAIWIQMSVPQVFYSYIKRHKSEMIFIGYSSRIQKRNSESFNSNAEPPVKNAGLRPQPFQPLQTSSLLLPPSMHLLLQSATHATREPPTHLNSWFLPPSIEKRLVSYRFWRILLAYVELSGCYKMSTWEFWRHARVKERGKGGWNSRNRESREEKRRCLTIFN